MDYKQYAHSLERQNLSAYAAKSYESKGRVHQIVPCPLRTDFVRDRDRIIHSKSFRRLKHKTQVFLIPEGDHYRTRLTHTLEVMQVARIIARALRLNEDLTEAIALAHDLGHTPFGHAGENALNAIYPFKHNEQSLRVVDVLENDFKGMNLTHEVRDGILNHTSSGSPSTLEGCVVSWADRIAYINHDIDDALRAEIIKEDDIPKKFTQAFGDTHGERINSMVTKLIDNSFDKPFVNFSQQDLPLVNEFRDFMFDAVYTNAVAKAEDFKTVSLITMLFEYYKADLSRLPQGFRDEDCSDEQKICDFIANMTDRYAVMTFQKIFVPQGWQVM